jgi:hypothetical protein
VPVHGLGRATADQWWRNVEALGAAPVLAWRGSWSVAVGLDHCGGCSEVVGNVVGVVGVAAEDNGLPAGLVPQVHH